MTLYNVQRAMVKGSTWMDLYVGSAEERAKLSIPVNQKTRLTRTSINLHAETMPVNILCAHSAAQRIIVSI
jgi:hypothetical protein